MQIPISINKCPVAESILEIRYSSDLPSDAIFGVVYAKIKNIFTNSPTTLPIMQVPETVRTQDQNLKYQPHYSFQKNNFNFNIGPKSLIFTCKQPYSGWNKWSVFIYSILDEIMALSLISKIERIGLRYINVFNSNIFDVMDVNLTLSNKSICNDPTHIRTQIQDGEIAKIIQVGNGAKINVNGQDVIGSVVDIDCVFDNSVKTILTGQYKNLIEMAHQKEREQFFSLLQDDFIKSLEPTF